MVNKEYIFNAKRATQDCIDWIKRYFVDTGNNETVAIIGISGGKDSAVAAALCAKALGPEQVVGIKMPQGKQIDIEYADALIKYLHIKSYEVDIGEICNNFYDNITTVMKSCDFAKNRAQITSNLPARVRMTILYAFAAALHGRVVNTCNYSEDYVGYSTKFGDSAGDFAPLANFTTDEVVAIGKELDLPFNILSKPPEDGLSGLTDEENLGFTYQELNKYLRRDIVPSVKTLYNIETRHKRNLHKIRRMPVFPLSATYFE